MRSLYLEPERLSWNGSDALRSKRGLRESKNSKTGETEESSE